MPTKQRLPHGRVTPFLLQRKHQPNTRTHTTHLSRATASGAGGLGLEGAERGSGGLDDYPRATALPARVGLGARLNAAAIAGVAPFQVADANLRGEEDGGGGWRNNEIHILHRTLAGAKPHSAMH